jgi:hypothetical protein
MLPYGSRLGAQMGLGSGDKSMIRKKPAPHLMRGGYRFSEKIMLK